MADSKMDTTEAKSTPATRTVIIAFDGSEYAKYALKFFSEKVHMPNDRVVVAYCVELSEVITTAHFSIDQGEFKELIARESERVKEKLVEFGKIMKEIKLKGTLKSIHATTPGLGIISIANEENADLIVTGSRGQGKLRRTFLGSVSDYVIHHSSIPVMVVTLKDQPGAEKK